MSFQQDSTNEDPAGTNEQASSLGQPSDAAPQSPPPVGEDGVSAGINFYQTDGDTGPVAPVGLVTDDTSVPVAGGATETTSVAVQLADDASDSEVDLGLTDAGGESNNPRTRSSMSARLLSIVLTAALFGAAGYWIAPRQAGSSTTDETSALALAQQKFEGTQKILLATKEAKAALAAELATIKQQAEDAAKAEDEAREKLATSEKSVAKLGKEVSEASSAAEPLVRKLAAAEKLAEKSRAAADEAEARSEKLRKQLAGVTKRRDALDAQSKALLQTKAQLTQDLARQRQVAGELKRLLEALDMGAMPKDTPPAGPAEMPVTVKELTRAMGQPTVSFQSDETLEMTWAGEHVATGVGGVVATIDGEPATRALVAEVAKAPPRRQAAPGAWRVAKGEKLLYADLVDMFGPPERVAGKGTHFKARWSVGAWARKASAEVVDGVVTRFDGREVNPAEVCSLVAHRPEAYRPEARGGIVSASAASAKACYEYVAKTLMPAKLKVEAGLKGRDGQHLTKWTLAPLDSVSTWAFQTDTPIAGSVTLRAALDCTWTAGNGDSTTERRYVVVTVGTTDRGGVQTSDYACIDARD